MVPQHQDFPLDPEKQITINGFANRLTVNDVPRPPPLANPVPQYERIEQLSPNVVTVSVAVESPPPSEGSPSPAPSVSNQRTPPVVPVAVPMSPGTTETPLTNGKAIAAPEPIAGSSTVSSPVPSPKPATTRKVSSFRHVPLRNAPAPRPKASSPLRPQGDHARTLSNVSLSSRHLDSLQPQPPQGNSSSRVSSAASTPHLQPVTNDKVLPSIPALDVPARSPSIRPVDSPIAVSPSSQGVVPPSRASTLVSPSVPPPTAVSPAPSQATSIPPTPASAISPSSSSSSIPTARQPTRSTAPYRPGFQPKGVYRPRTDEFIEIRKAGRDSGRVERTRLERRLEKLVNLHFPHPDLVKEKEKSPENGRLSTQNRRQSSFFDLTFNDLRTKSAGDLWKEVVATQPAPGSKADIRCEHYFWDLNHAQTSR